VLPKVGSLVSLTSRCVTDLDGIRALEPAWRAVWDRSGDATVFTGYDWALAAAEAFAATRSPRVIVVEREREVVGILPLAIENGTVLFLGAPESDSNDLVCLPGLESEVAAVALRAVFGLPGGWRRCMLDNLWEDSALRLALSRLRGPPFSRYHLRFRGVAPRAVLGDAEATARIVKKKNELKLERRLSKQGHLVFRFLEEPGDVHAGMEHLIRLHIARYRDDGDSSVFLNPAVCAFYDILLPRLDPTSELRFFVMELDGRVLACQLAFQDRGRLFCAKTAYDAEFRDYSPGTVLIRHLAMHAAEQGLAILDHSRGEQPYKARFSTETKRYYSCRVFPRGLVGWTQGCLLRLKERAKGVPAVARVRRVLRRVHPAGAAKASGTAGAPR